MNLFRAAVAPLARARPFFASVTRTGGHLASLRALAIDRSADVAAIDCVTFAFVREHLPELANGVRVIGFTGDAPGLPFITSNAVAAGDVARWPSSFADAPVRIEHWTNANEHGALVAAAIMGQEAPRAQPPYVWSDQYGHRIQIAGTPRAGQPAVMAGSVADGTLVALFADGEQRTVGAVVLDDARTFMRARRAVGARTPVGQVDLGLAAAKEPDTGRSASQTQTTRRND